TNENDIVAKIKGGDRSAKERTLKMGIAETGGRWFLATPPRVERPGDCDAAVRASMRNNSDKWAKAKLGEAARLRLEKAMTQHCGEDGWNDETIVCIED